MKLLKKRSSLFWIVFLLLFVVNLWIAVQIPYGKDDWSWGSPAFCPAS